MKNFMIAAEESVVIVHPDSAVDEYFEGFFRGFEGNPTLMANLDAPLHSIAGYSDGAKARLKFFLSDPNAGALWKLNDYAPSDTESWKRYITRGVLGELDAYNRVYKPHGFGHATNAPGYDCTGSKWVQIKTCKNPNTIQNIADQKAAIEDLVAHSPGSPTQLKLHILKEPGTDSSILQDALTDYLLDKPYRSRFELKIDPYDIGPQ